MLWPLAQAKFYRVALALKKVGHPCSTPCQYGVTFVGKGFLVSHALVKNVLLYCQKVYCHHLVLVKLDRLRRVQVVQDSRE